MLLSPLPPLENPDIKRVMSYYLSKINTLPSSGCVEALKAYTEDLGADVVIHAFDRAVDEKKTGWSYIRAILQNYTQAGYHTLQDVIDSEAEFNASKKQRDMKEN